MAKASKPQTVTVVVRNLPVDTSEHQLRALCASFGEVVEAEIPSRTARFDRFIFGFVRFAGVEAAQAAVSRLKGLVVQGRRLYAEMGRNHWRNTNEETVQWDDSAGDGEGEQDKELEMSEGELHTAVLQECRRQWHHHLRRHPHRGLPNFDVILERVSRAPAPPAPSSRSEEVLPKP